MEPTPAPSPASVVVLKPVRPEWMTLDYITTDFKRRLSDYTRLQEPYTDDMLTISALLDENTHLQARKQQIADDYDFVVAEFDRFKVQTRESRAKANQRFLDMKAAAMDSFDKLTASRSESAALREELASVRQEVAERKQKEIDALRDLLTPEGESYSEPMAARAYEIRMRVNWSVGLAAEKLGIDLALPQLGDIAEEGPKVPLVEPLVKMIVHPNGKIEPPCWPCPGCVASEPSECMGLRCIHQTNEVEEGGQDGQA